jgi:putative transcriptional regulator
MATKSLNNKAMDPKRIQEIRRRLRVTQEDFAHMVGVTFSTVNRWENGKSKPNRIAQRILMGLEKKIQR